LNLERPINWLLNEVGNFPEPFLSYFHLLPPHWPYATRIDFYDEFIDDSYIVPRKPEHVFTDNISYQNTEKGKREYDEYLLYADSEFARLFNRLEKTGVLENTWVILTSDHGEMFERGIIGHSTHASFQPVFRIPLLIFEPGQKVRKDIHHMTSAVDIVPTLLNINGKPIPEWIEGEVLPPYSNKESVAERKLYVVNAKNNKNTEPLKEASISIIDQQYTLTKYIGYKELENGKPRYEMYDIKNDPEELNNVASTEKNKFNDLLEILEYNHQKADEPYS